MTVLPRSGSNPQELLLISTKLFDLSIKGVPINKWVKAFQEQQNIKGELQYASFFLLSHDYPAQVWVYDPYCVSGLAEYQGNEMFPCFFEHNHYEVVIRKKEKCPDNLALHHPNRKLRDAVSPTGPNGDILSGVINFDDEVGVSRFEVRGGGRNLLSFELEVFPGKLDYREDYFKLLQEVNVEVYNLAFDFLMKTQFAAGLKQEAEPSPAEYISILKILFVKLTQALEQVMRSPHQKVVALDRIVRPEKVKKADVTTVKWLASRPHLFERQLKGLNIGGASYIPRKVLDQKKERTYDTYENRFLKWVIRRILRNLGDFLERYQIHCSHNPDIAVLENINTMQKNLTHYLRRSILRDVGILDRVDISSLVMQMAPGYRDVYKYHLMLLKGLNIQSDLFNISVKNTATLYEYWCFLKLNSLMRQRYDLKRNGLVQVDRRGITVQLKKGKESTMYFHDPRNGEEFSLVFNRFYTSLPTTAQKPDNVLILEKEGSDTRYHYVFDAKYRLSVDEDYIKQYNQPGPPEDAINAMHRYRDAILSSQDRSEVFNRSVFGAFVLFPHNDEMTYAGKNGAPPSRFFESIDSSGIGALPFLPSQTSLVSQFFDELFVETPQTAFERNIFQEGTVEYFGRRSERRNVLIGPLGSREQLDICLKSSMYYTYLEKVQTFLSDLDYVALYQSKRLFPQKERHGIFWFGKIRNFLICKRKEIKEISSSRPGSGDALVVQFVIEKWEEKRPSIATAGYGPSSPQRTYWSVFYDAKIYPELHLDQLEIRLWRELRRLDSCLEIRFPRNTIDSDDRAERLLFPGLEFIKTEGADNFLIRVNGKAKQYSFDMLKRSPGKTLRDIIRFWKAGN